MPVIDVRLDGDNCWPDLKAKVEAGRLIHIKGDGPPIGLAMLEGGMVSGKPSVALRIDLPDGRTVLAETSVELFLTAAAAVRGRMDFLRDRN
jgi:hypothetical protein